MNHIANTVKKPLNDANATAIDTELDELEKQSLKRALLYLLKRLRRSQANTRWHSGGLALEAAYLSLASAEEIEAYNKIILRCTAERQVHLKGGNGALEALRTKFAEEDAEAEKAITGAVKDEEE